MTRLRVTIAQLMTLIVFVAFGFAALRNSDGLWATATYTLAVISILTAILLVCARKGKARFTALGFAVFGCAYYWIDLLPDRGVGSLGAGPVPWPKLIIQWGAGILQPYVHPIPSSRPFDWVQYDQVSHSLGIIVFGLFGAVVGRIVARTGERSNA
jgi:hypothetical protein